MHAFTNPRLVITVIQFPAIAVWSVLSRCWMWMSAEILASKFLKILSGP